MQNKFISSPNGRGAPAIDSMQDLSNAFDTIYWFRQSYGLEDNYYNSPIYLDQVESTERKFGAIQEAAYESADIEFSPNAGRGYSYSYYYGRPGCSNSTNTLLDIYQSYVRNSGSSFRHVYLYPLIDRTIEWFEDQYGN